VRRWHLTVLFAGLVLLLLVLVYLIVYVLRPQGGTPSGGTNTGVVPLLTISGPGIGEHPTFDRPLGAAFGPDGRIYVTDSGNARVCVFDASGRFLVEFGGLEQARPASPTVTATSGVTPGSSAPRAWLSFPAGIDVTEDGKVYVADARGASVEVFDTEGVHIRSYLVTSTVSAASNEGSETVPVRVEGGVATANNSLTDVAVIGDLFYVTTSDSIVIVAPLVPELGGSIEGRRFAVGLDRPNGVATAPDGTVYVSDSNRQRVVSFAMSGTELWATDETATAGPGAQDRAAKPPELGLPRGLDVDGDGTILVADSLEHRIVRLTALGALVRYYGEFGSGPDQFSYPNDVEARNGLVLVADKGNGRVLVARLVDTR
jgi:tripartite motif-containing protein 71